MTQQPIPVRNGAHVGDMDDDRKGMSSTLRGVSALLIVIVATSAIITVWNGVFFGLDFIDAKFELEKSVQESVPMKIFLSLLIIGAIGALRYVVSAITGAVRKIFRIGQYDIVTIVTAVVINGVLLWLNTWITRSTIDLMEKSGVDNFFTNGGAFPYIVMFCTLAGALIWIPRVGVYGENRLGQFDADNHN